MKISSENKYFLHTLVEEIPFGMIAMDFEGKVALINPSALLYLGLESSDDIYLDTDIHSFISSRILKNKINSILDDKISSFKLKAVKIKNKYLNFNGIKLFDSLIIHINDVTESIILRDQATQSLIMGQEFERKRLSKEIHDGIGPALSTIKLHIESVNMKIENPILKAKLNDVISMIAETTNDIRQISHDLMPSSLIDFGLLTALSNLIKRLNNTESIIVRFESNLSDAILSKELEFNLFRIIQELLNNALKYSKCTEIQIQLNLFDGRLHLTFYDDGIGMDKDLIGDGIGIKNIATRVKSFRGDFELDSELGHGVNCNIIIPLN